MRRSISSPEQTYYRTTLTGISWNPSQYVGKAMDDKGKMGIIDSISDVTELLLLSFGLVYNLDPIPMHAPLLQCLHDSVFLRTLNHDLHDRGFGT